MRSAFFYLNLNEHGFLYNWGIYGENRVHYTWSQESEAREGREDEEDEADKDRRKKKKQVKPKMLRECMKYLLLFAATLLLLIFSSCSRDSQNRISAAVPPFLPPLLSLLPNSLSKKVTSFTSSLSPRIVGIEGMVEDCTCAVEVEMKCPVIQFFYILSLQFVHECIGSLLHNLDQLCNTTFFKYFKVNYLKPCPFWDDPHVCEAIAPKDGEEGGSCGVQPCSENEIPPLWRERERERKDCEERERSEREKSKIEKEREGGGPEWIDRNERLWIVQDDEDGKEEGALSYINLKINPEKYTGYGFVLFILMLFFYIV